MLISLSIRDVVLIEALEIEFHAGLNVLTGETGAGKSILLDALGFCLGKRVRRDLVRAGQDQGVVTAVFGLAADHPVRALLADLGVSPEGDELILRRIASQNGPSRGFINDQRVSADVLGQIGDLLVEVHGQHDDRGLLNARAHRSMLDVFGKLDKPLHQTRSAWTAWRNAETALSDARETLAKAAADADFLRHSVDELEALSPQAGEDAALDSERRLVKQAAGLVEELGKARDALSGNGAEHALGDALSRLTHVAERAEGLLEPVISAVDRTLAELSEAQSGLSAVLDQLSFDPGRLEDVEERLFAVRGLARKHNVAPDDLAVLAKDLSQRLAAIDQGEDRLTALEAEASTAGDAYRAAAEELSFARRKSAETLDSAVTQELAPLKMENARFSTEIGVAEPGPDGIDAVRFTAAINPGATPGPIDRIASGGELARFLLAMKVQLARQSGGQTMIFDEIDRGVGGATADAVGRRLSRLSQSGQVLVVTHSPQVAAQGDHHYLIEKSADAGDARTTVNNLGKTERRDEIARMLAGGSVTDAARSAARALLEDAG